MQGTGTNGRKRIIIEVISVLVLGILITMDQLSKYYFSTNLSVGEDINIIDGFFYFTYVINTGAAWSFLAGVPWAQTFFKVLTGVALVLFVLFYFYASKNNKITLKIGILLVLSGTLGNFIDRLAMNGVVDFIGFIFGEYRFPVFNLADSFLTIGVVLIIVHYLFLDKNAVFSKKDDKKDNISE